MKQELTASRVFSAIGVFDLFRGQLHLLFSEIPLVITAKVSLDRVNDFLHNTELLDSFTEQPNTDIAIAPQNVDNDAIGFRNATFAWATQVSGTPTPSRRNFRLRIEEELTFKLGKINMIVGPTGCGKTSLIMALLGELHFLPSGPDSWFNLPRDGGVAYAAQEAWVQNEVGNALNGLPSLGSCTDVYVFVDNPGMQHCRD